MRTVSYRPVSITVDETVTHWLVTAVPTGRGRYDLRARLPKCEGHAAQEISAVSAKGGACRYCDGWNAYGVAEYVRKLLRSYRKVAVKVAVA